MPKIPITPADLAKTRNLDPGWYGATIQKVGSLETAKSGKSFNQKIDALVEGTDKVITMTFNSELWGKMEPLWKACTGQSISESSKTPDGNYDVDTDILLGKKFDGKVGQRLHEGNLYDEFQAFLPYGASKGQQLPF